MLRPTVIFSLPFYILKSLQLDALSHPFFDELRDPNTRLLNGRFLPPLFNFKTHGMILFFTRVVEILIYHFILHILFYFLYPLILLHAIRIERSAGTELSEINSRTCKKAMCLPWLVI